MGRAMSDWTIDQNPHYTHATRRRGSELIEVALDDEHLDIDYEIGTGYMRESARFSIPMSVLAQLFVARGYELCSSTAIPKEDK